MFDVPNGRIPNLHVMQQDNNAGTNKDPELSEEDDEVIEQLVELIRLLEKWGPELKRVHALTVDKPKED